MDSFENLHVQNEEAPELIDSAAHKKFFKGCRPHGIWCFVVDRVSKRSFRNELPADTPPELVHEGDFNQLFEPCSGNASFHLCDKHVASFPVVVTGMVGNHGVDDHHDGRTIPE